MLPHIMSPYTVTGPQWIYVIFTTPSPINCFDSFIENDPVDMP